jgi:hypothetical protein
MLAELREQQDSRVSVTVDGETVNVSPVVVNLTTTGDTGACLATRYTDVPSARSWNTTTDAKEVESVAFAGPDMT